MKFWLIFMKKKKSFFPCWLFSSNTVAFGCTEILRSKHQISWSKMILFSSSHVETREKSPSFFFTRIFGWFFFKENKSFLCPFFFLYRSVAFCWVEIFSYQHQILWCEKVSFSLAHLETRQKSLFVLVNRSFVWIFMSKYERFVFLSFLLW